MEKPEAGFRFTGCARGLLSRRICLVRHPTAMPQAETDAVPKMEAPVAPARTMFSPQLAYLIAVEITYLIHLGSSQMFVGQVAKWTS